MKRKHFLTAVLLYFFIASITATYGQSTGDLSFTAFNADGDKDFAVVALADISPNTTIYFTDRESIEPGDFNTGEGTLIWTTGGTIIKAGTIIVFTDIDNDSNLNFGASIGSLSRIGNFNVGASKDAIFAYTGTDTDTVTTFISALQIGNNATETGDLTGTGLTTGTTHIIIDLVASPDGGYYNGSRTSQSTYANYLTLLGDTTNNWTTTSSTGDGESLLSISKEAFTNTTTTWTGNTSTDWNVAGNWTNGVPTTHTNVTIPTTTNSPLITTDMTTGNLTLNSGTALTITGTLTNKGVTLLNSGASLISSTGSISGTVLYCRTLSTNWHLVASPVLGETIENYNAKNTLTTGGTGTNIALATYNNSWTSPETSGWVYKTTASTGLLTSAKGYATKRATAGNITFTGTMPTTNINLTITDGVTNKFNLIGNPYPSYIPANSLADGSTNILTINGSAGTNQLSEDTIWFWNETTSSYTTVNLASSARFIAPAQGFFVSSKAGGGTFSFTEAMQSHQAIDLFNKTTTGRFEINLSISDGTTSKTTTIYYITGTTAAFDNGYDSSLFGGVSNSFAIYTQTVADNQGKNLAIQSLPNKNHQQMIIPVGINAVSGKEIVFSTDVTNIPSGMKVFLENRHTNTFTRLDTVNSSYKTMPTKLRGIGQFYLYVSPETPHTNTFNPNNVSLYKTNNSTLRVTGLQPGSASIKLFTILGKRLIWHSFKSNGIKDIPLPQLPTGVYIVQLQTKAGTVRKKISLH